MKFIYRILLNGVFKTKGLLCVFVAIEKVNLSLTVSLALIISVKKIGCKEKSQEESLA